MARMGIFIDVSNLYYCIKKKFDRKLDYRRYKDYVLGNHELVRANAYGAQDSTEANAFLGALRSFGYLPRYKRPKAFDNPNYRIDIEAFEELLKLPELAKLDEKIINRLNSALDATRKALRSKKDIKKADWDVGLAIDVVRVVNRVDIVVLGSGDGDLAPLVEYIKEQQAQCVICACNISRELHDVADSCIEIDEDLLEAKPNGN
jgi:uncharacterized LabA/DUF88 family protein